jgi:hypothetical protein
MAFQDEVAEKFGNITGDEWLAISQGLGQGRNWQEGLSAATGGLRQARAAKAAGTRQTALDKAKEAQQAQTSKLTDLQIEQTQQKIDAGQLTKVGNALYDPINKTWHYPDPAELAKLKRASGTTKTTEHVPRPPVYDETGGMWFQSYNKDTGARTWEGPGGAIRTTPPPGATRPSDSIYGEMGKIDKAFLAKLDAEGDKATDELLTAERSLQLLADPDVWTGFGAEVISDFKSAMITAGFASEETVNAIAKIDEFRKLSFEFVMKQVAGTKGAVSDREMELFAKASPGLAKTERGNRRILEGIKILSERKRAQKRFMNEQMLGKGMPAWKAEEKWEEYLKENPIFEKGWFEVLDDGTPIETEPVEVETPTMPGQRVPGAMTTEDYLNKYAPQ